MTVTNNSNMALMSSTYSTCKRCVVQHIGIITLGTRNEEEAESRSQQRKQVNIMGSLWQALVGKLVESGVVENKCV